MQTPDQPVSHQTQEETPEPTPSIDQSPALAGVAPQFNSQAPEGVDTTTLPPFADTSRMLPAQRVTMEMELAKVAAGLPRHIIESDSDSLDIYSMSSDDLDAVAYMITRVQDVVISRAQDSDAMEAWLVDQQEPLQAVMYAFSVYQEQVKN